MQDPEPSSENRMLELEQQIRDLQSHLGRQAARLRAMEDWAKQVSLYYQGETSRPDPAAPENPAAGAPAAPFDLGRTSSGPGTSNDPAAAAGVTSDRWQAAATRMRGPGAARAGAAARSYQSSVDIEWVVGGSWLNRIGAVALVLGLAFFLKLAIDNGWITETMQALFGILLGAGLIAGGEMARRRSLGNFSIGLSSAGFASLYITVYASYSYYHLIGFSLSFAALALISASMIGEAMLLNIEAIAVVGTLCGFLTPIILSGAGETPGSSNILPLFGYLWLLDAGVLAAAARKRWQWLKVGSLVLTQLFFAGWLSQHYRPEIATLLSEIATSFFVLYIGIGAAYTAISGRDADEADIFILLENPMLYAILLVSFYVSRASEMLGLYALFLSCVYTALTWLALRKKSWGGAITVCLLAVAVSFFTGAIPLLLGKDLQTAAWCAEALILLWGGCRIPALPIRTAAYTLYVFVGAWLAFSLSARAFNSLTAPASLQTFTLDIEIPLIVFIVALVAGGRMLWRRRLSIPAEERSVERVMGITACITGFILITAEVIHRGGGLTGAAVSTWLSAAWSVYAVLLLGLGVAMRRSGVRLCALALLGLVIAKIFLYDIWLLDLVFRVISLFVLAAGLWGSSYLYARYRDRLKALVQDEVLPEGTPV